MSSATTRPIHPTALAFSDALQGGSSCNRASESIQKRSRVLGWRNRHSQAERYPVKMLNNKSFSVKQVQRGEVEGKYGTGATVWPASMVLLKYLERHPSIVCNRSVIDLGAGTGVTSIGAALLGAKRVVCTDGCAKVVQLAKENVEEAACQELKAASDEGSSNDENVATVTLGNCEMQVKEYWWGDGSMRGKFDVILVSDCVLPKLYPIEPLVDAIDELFDNDSVAILSYEHRYYPEYDPKEKFRVLAASRGMQVQIIPLSKQDPVYSVDDIEIWEVRRTQ